MSILAKAGEVSFLACLVLTTAPAQEKSVLNEPWVEVRSPHFNCYSSAGTQDVCRLTTKLEQFYQAYACLAGTQAVASPPVVVIAFKNLQAMRPFLPRYQDQPASIAAFFKRSEDENLIVMALAGSARDPMLLVYHEYSHLLMRRNQRIWPVWLHEGMAEIYATFQMKGEDKAVMAQPFGSHIVRLKQRGLMPLSQLLAVTHESPEYNEREGQAVFYAQSWLLTHYVMVGNGKRLPQFGRYSVLLKAGESSEEAFIHAFQAPLSAMEAELRQYLQRGQFPVQPIALSNAGSSGQALQLRSLAGDEVCFRIGDQLLPKSTFGARRSCRRRTRGMPCRWARRKRPAARPRKRAPRCRSSCAPMCPKRFAAGPSNCSRAARWQGGPAPRHGRTRYLAQGN